MTGIAVVGVSGRYPRGADTPARLWTNLLAGVDGVTEARGDRWDLGYHHPDPARADRIYTRACGLLESIDGFDNEFFGLSPREARQVDPQQRLLLELAWEALEDAAIPLDRIAGTDAGVFVGISSNDYASLVGPGGPDAYSNTGSSFSIAANRISYFLDLHGPSVALDTACSSTIVAVHQACTSLLARDCSVALVGGISLLVHVRPWLGFAKASMLSPTGRCKSFDASGDGYVRSEGGGIVVLKPLADAERDGDTIYGVIVGSGVNSDGHTLGLSMPNVDAQEQLLRKVYAGCGVPPENVVYVEAHGTGTAVGDPIECESIGRVLGAPRADGSTLLIGSVKSNIGHLEAASGMAGLTKALLVLRSGEIPANLHFNDPNPKIRFDDWKLAVVEKTTPLPVRDEPVVVGVNSFGFGGTNAHLAIAAHAPAPPSRATPAAASPGLLLLSGHTPDALKAVAASFADFLRSNPALDWSDACAAAALSRTHLRHRFALSASSASDAAAKLERFVAGETPPRSSTGSSGAKRSPAAFVYSGNGPQWFGMGRELMDHDADFRREIETIDAVFAPLAGWSLVAEMRRPESESRIAFTEYAQPLLFALQVALTARLRAAGIEPAVTLGHSVGEVAAAHVAGALTLEQAVLVIFNRSMHQARTAGTGTMAAVGVGTDEALEAMRAVPGWLELAASNAPKAVTIAGDPAALETLRANMTEAGKFARVLALQYPFHTTAMDAIRDDLIASLATLRPGASTIPFVSTVDAREVGGEELDATYWWRNVREPVRFREAIDLLIDERGVEVFLEIGPHPVLRDYIAQCAKAKEKTVAALGTLRRPAPNKVEVDADNLATALCAAYAAGAGSLDVFVRPVPMPALPLYPWQRTRHWRGTTVLPDAPQPIERVHPLLGHAVSAGDGLWQNTLDVHQQPYLKDHVVAGAVVFPAAGYIECGLAAARDLLGNGTLELESFEILRPLTLPDHSDPVIQCAVGAKDGAFQIHARFDKHFGTWTQHVRGRVSRSEIAPIDRIDPVSTKARLAIHVSGAEHYAAASMRGLDYGPAFAGVCDIWLSDPSATTREAFAEIDLSSFGAEAFASHVAHPALTDSAFQVILTLIGFHDPRTYSIIPVYVDRVRSFAPLPSHFFCAVTIVRESARSAVANFSLYDAEGTLVATLFGTRCQKVDFTRGSASSLIVEGWRPDASAGGRSSGADLPSTAALASGFAAAVDEAAAAAGRDAFHRDVRPALDRLASAYAAEALRELGAAEGPFDVARLARRGRVKRDRERLLQTLIELAEAGGAIERVERGWAWNDARSAESTAALWRELFRRRPRYAGELRALAHAGENLIARLRSTVDAAESDRTRAGEDLADGSATRAFAHDALAVALRSVVAAWPHDRPIRVLELDGADGGFAASALEVLPAGRTEYVFTDPSEASVGRAEHRLDRFSFVRFASLDAERDANPLGRPPQSFDVVVVANVPDTALRRDAVFSSARSFLIPGGLVLALEPAAYRYAAVARAFGSANVEPETESLERALARSGFADSVTAFECDGAHPVVVVAKKPATSPALAPPPVAAIPPRRWAILSDRDEHHRPLLASLLNRLRACGQSVDVHVLAPGAPIADALRNGDADSIVLLPFCHAVADAERGPDATDSGCRTALALVHAIEASRHDRPPQVTFVTRGALASPFAGPLDPSQAALWGLVRVIANEYSGLGARLVDVHAAEAVVESGDWIAGELLRRDDETEVLLHDGARYVNRERIVTLAELGTVEPSRSYRLDFLPQGGLDSLHVRSFERRDPQANEVEIRVAAAGLNFRDVLWAMGMLPEEAVENGFAGATIGMECAGEVVRVGRAVTNVRAGDRVIAFASSCFASHVTTDAGSVAKMPDGLRFDEAATIPIAFLTAYYALVELARVSPGETVLVHGAAGGVGLAAVQIAKLKGARVIGTAGSDAKRRLLELIGVDRVFDSRSLAFADDVMRFTNGTGVDVVLNSLAGEAIAKGLGVLRPFGRFLEIGKRDFYADSRIGLRPFRQNLSYFGIDADTLLIERPDLARRIFETVAEHFANGDLHALPVQSVPVARAAEAFRTMQQSKHVGKIVIAMPDDSPSLRIVPEAAPVRADGTYLITGGLGGFGLATAEWLVARGARSIALVGRRGASTDEARAGIAAMEAAGATVRAFAADVSDRAAVDDVLARVRRELPPLRGVYHSAAVIEDAPIMNVTDDLLERVWEPKARGAWNLHRATQGDPIETFVLYSSVSAMIGNPGQGAYVAANLYLESLAQHRRALGLPALAVGWGAIKDAGFLTRNRAVAEMLEHRSGLDATPVADALAELGRLRAVDVDRVCVARYNLHRLGQMLSGARIPRFAALIPAGVDASSDAAETLADLVLATAPDERRGLVVARIRHHASRVLGTTANQVEIERPLAEMGLDSLMAVELAEAVERDVSRPMSVMEMLGAGTVGAIADLVLKTLGVDDDASTSDARPLADAVANEAITERKDLVAAGG